MSIERRATVHAALGEPVRLAIVDRLGPGDASPGEPAPGAQEVFPLAARGAEVEVVSPVPAKRAAVHVNVFQHGETKTVEFGWF